ncbi:MAG TPA: ABC transporter [Spirochaetia bacterium]|nr:ABC transporter [Spirochaetia bacterium]
MSLIHAEKITKNYQLGEIQVQALKGIDFELKESRFVSFIGPSGSGKTTLLNLLGCLDKPSEGYLEIGGTNVLKFNRTESALFRSSKIGFIFQDFNLIPVLSVYENIEYPLLMLQTIPSKPERKKRIINLLEQIGMESQKDKYPHQISGGQKQRVAVARALVTHPVLVLADEPTANLDHATAFQVIHLMKKIKNDFGASFIFSTHDPKIVGEAELIYTLEDGLITSRKEIKGA